MARKADLTASGYKPSMMDKLYPEKIADGDGKAGFMSWVIGLRLLYTHVSDIIQKKPPHSNI